MKKYDKYKSSWVEWIGDIPEHWEVMKLKYIVDIFGRIGFRGYTVDDIVAESMGAISLSPSNINDNKLILKNNTYISFEKYEESPEIKIFNKDVIFVKTGSTIGKVAYIELLKEKATINPQLVVFKNIKIHTKYLYYSFVSKMVEEQNILHTGGSTTPTLSQEKLNEYLLTIPTKQEQQQIANYLDKKTFEIDEIIADKENLIKLLEEEKEIIISNAVTKGLNLDVQMKDSGVEWIGDIPKHWEVRKLKYIFNFFDNERIPLSAYDRGLIKNKIYDYYGASGIIDKVDDYIFDGEYILIGEDGANLLDRNSNLAFKAVGKFWVNNHAHILKPKNGNIDFFVYFLENLDYKIWISGSAQPKLTAEALKNIEIFYPNKQEQQQIVDFLDKKTDEINQTIQTIKDEIKLLKEYKEILIYEVVTGKIDVREEKVS